MERILWYLGALSVTEVDVAYLETKVAHLAIVAPTVGRQFACELKAYSHDVCSGFKLFIRSTVCADITAERIVVADIVVVFSFVVYLFLLLYVFSLKPILPAKVTDFKEKTYSRRSFLILI